MSDFGELCPLFSTGVFSEVTFPYIPMSAVTACGNALDGTLTITHAGQFSFGRTVVVTDAFIRRQSTGEEIIIRLMHHTSATAAGTSIGTITFAATGSFREIYTWSPITVTDKTFTSDEILGLAPATGTTTSAGIYDLIVRYKEK